VIVFSERIEGIVENLDGKLKFLSDKDGIINALIGFLYNHNFNGVLREMLQINSNE
jgi:hypothetical protein